MMEQIIIVVTAIVTAIPAIAATAARYRPLIEKALGKYKVLEEKARSALTVAENAMQAGQEIEETLMKIDKALQDKRLSKAEIVEINTELHEDYAVLRKLQESVKALLS